MLAIDFTEQHNIKEQIVENISKMIFSGVLSKGDFLPSIRTMSEKYGISRSTIIVAYKTLESLGYIEGRERSCYIVVGTTSCQPQQPSEPPSMHQANTGINLLAKRADICNKLHLYDNAILPRHFIRKWCQDIDYIREGQHKHAHGDISTLRHNLNRYIKIARGARLAPENMLIVQGLQEAIAIIAHYGKMGKSDPSIIIEDPASPQIFQLFSCLGYKIFPVRVGENGLDVASFPKHDVDFIYTSPANHFPSGAKMSSQNRAALLAWSQTHNAIIIENDSSAMLGFGEQVIPPLQDNYPVNNIIYVSSLSELVGNSANLGLLVLPDLLLPVVNDLRRLISSETHTLSNKMISAFLGSNYFMKYLANTLQVRRTKFDLALTGLKQVITAPDNWGLVHSGFFSFAAPEGALPPEIKESTFFPLEMFCQQADPLWKTPRYIYPIGSLSLHDIEKINKRLITL